VRAGAATAEGRRRKSSRTARDQLGALFGEGPARADDDPRDALEALFRKK